MKLSLCVTVLATVWASVLANSGGNPPNLPPCDELKKLVSDGSQTDAGIECGDNEDESLARGFSGTSAFQSGGGFGSGFGGSSKGIVYDPYCNKWMGVTLSECPIAFYFDPYESLCKVGTGSWWSYLSREFQNNQARLPPWERQHRNPYLTKPLYFINRLGSGTNFCANTVHFACPVLGNTCPPPPTRPPWFLGNPGIPGHNPGNSHGHNHGQNHGSNSWVEDLLD